MHPRLFGKNHRYVQEPQGLVSNDLVGVHGVSGDEDDMAHSRDTLFVTDLHEASAAQDVVPLLSIGVRVICDPAPWRILVGTK